MVGADALTYAPDRAFDAGHCRLVLLHQPRHHEFSMPVNAKTPGAAYSSSSAQNNGPASSALRNRDPAEVVRPRATVIPVDSPAQP